MTTEDAHAHDTHECDEHEHHGDESGHYGINHVSVQLEHTASVCREDHHVDHLLHTSRPSAS